MTEITLNLIVALCTSHGIGYKGSIPWMLKKDLSHFSKLTKQTENPNSLNAVIMGRKTWESLPNKFKPLPGRYNVVLSRNNHLAAQIEDQHVLLCPSLDEAVKVLKIKKSKGEIENVWVIGGSAVYEESLKSPYCDKVFVTKILKDFTCDTFFPSLGDNFKEVEDSKVQSNLQQENDMEFKFQVFKKIN